MFQKTIVKIARALDKHRIPYMIIGGQAVLLYGTPRLTRDIDVTVGADTDRLDDVVQAAEDAGLKIIPKRYRDFVARTMTLPVQDRRTGIRADFIFSFTPYEAQAIKHAKSVRLGTAKIRFATAEDIIIHKVFSGRPRDLEDVRSILIKNRNIDTGYIIKWLKDFDTASETSSKLVAAFKSLFTKSV
jgi:predicted nucleotidyltransferase